MTQTSENNSNLPKFLKLFPIPGSLLSNIAPNLFSNSYSSLYPSIYISLPIFLVWTGFEFIKNILFFNTNRNIQKLSYYMPFDSKSKSITNNLFNDWNKFFYSDNYGLSPKRFVTSYTNDMKYMFHSIKDDDYRLVRVDEHNSTTTHYDDDLSDDDEEDDYSYHHNRNRTRNSIIVPNPKYRNRNSSLPLPTFKHFLLQNNTLFSIIMLHCTLLPISRLLLKFNALFLPNKNQSHSHYSSTINGGKFKSLQSITSHKNNSLNSATSKVLKLSTILLSHTYCMLHVVCTSIIPIIAIRSSIFRNLSTQLLIRLEIDL